MDTNNGIQISGGTFHADTLAVGPNARAIKANYAPGSKPPTSNVQQAAAHPASSKTKVFVSYSHQDTRWLERLRVHLKPLEQKHLIELWDDSKITAGTRWRDALQTAIQSSAIALLLVSADFLASDFIITEELPKLLFRAEIEGTTIIPIILSPCLFNESDIALFQAINPPNRPLTAMSASERDEIFVKLARDIQQKLAL